MLAVPDVQHVTAWAELGPEGSAVADFSAALGGTLDAGLNNVPDAVRNDPTYQAGVNSLHNMLSQLDPANPQPISRCELQPCHPLVVDPRAVGALQVFDFEGISRGDAQPAVHA